MRLLTAANVLAVLVAIVGYQWTQIRPKVDWTPAPVQEFEACPADTESTTIMFGATSMLGKYIVESFRRDARICVVNFGRSKCKNCHINVKGDLRDTRHVHRALDAYAPDTVLTSVKPPLEGMHYKVYIELNLLSMLELIKAAKSKGVQQFIYVSSIAAASHFIAHNDTSEADPQPYYTDYEAPYDVSKRVAEDALLAAHEEGVFSTVSVRTSGIIGGPSDPYNFYYASFPFVPSFDTPAVVDINYAGNIGDALYVVHETLRKTPNVGGKFYYYTGEHMSEQRQAEITAAARGVPVLTLPYWLLEGIIDVGQFLRFEHNIYNIVDMFRMAVIPQQFDNSAFFEAFPDFKPRYTMEEAIQRVYKKKADP
ncbi:3 beta-hydroxysteroid dehydrogenase/Delta 5--_4-isomerase [Hondaea fermentalgiana]|uniref:3 beta-hydroxysteroid dehydrogenase/Delta 5-->4-isomerase n=1 Tax=Hondaea fermentalgiana TaxID=2315210 RepID=A0A2R5GV29_9STRA|nr:3 beta-hydroxysteroid dehydrogenase/Delta 5-->4-isomerase [Hondaea fermentalgiana]|eukprot:GBG33628.1 3 beta-hydroxysteroid dehydrogenase/Delta 5--_4-isomerase [Hondaea fermentalgiana]